MAWAVLIWIVWFARTSKADSLQFHAFLFINSVLGIGIE